jgi:hypothetical protein
MREKLYKSQKNTLYIVQNSAKVGTTTKLKRHDHVGTCTCRLKGRKEFKEKEKFPYTMNRNVKGDRINHPCKVIMP